MSRDVILLVLSSSYKNINHTSRSKRMIFEAAMQSQCKSNSAIIFFSTITKSLWHFYYLIKLYASWHCGWCLMCSKCRSVGRLAYAFSMFPSIFTTHNILLCLLTTQVHHGAPAQVTGFRSDHLSCFHFRSVCRFTTWVYRLNGDVMNEERCLGWAS